MLDVSPHTQAVVVFGVTHSLSLSILACSQVLERPLALRLALIEHCILVLRCGGSLLRVLSVFLDVGLLQLRLHVPLASS